METLTFEELKEKVGFGLAVEICQKILPEKFFNNLRLDDWLKIYREPVTSQKLRAFNIIKEALRIEIKSPTTGTFETEGEWFYNLGFSEKKLPKIKVGDRVKPNTIVGIVLSMGMPTIIRAGVHGRIKSVLVEDDRPNVDYGQLLFTVKPHL